MLARVLARWRGGAPTTVWGVLGWAALGLVGTRHARADEGASLDVPQVLGRVAPAIVKVNCGERWGTGTLFGDSQHLVTSFALINRGGAIVVHLPGGRGVSASVVAWSREDAIVLLKLGRAAKVAPLAAAETPPSAGDDILMPYHPRDTTLDPKNPGEAQVPLPVFGRVGRTGKTQLDLDARNINQPGLNGAPVLSANGTLLGFLDAERSWEQRRVIATRVERAQRLFAEREKAGEFSPDTDTSWFAGLFAVLGPEQSLGFGGIIGYRFEWLRLGVAGVGLSSGYGPSRGYASENSRGARGTSRSLRASSTKGTRHFWSVRRFHSRSTRFTAAVTKRMAR